MLQSKKGEKLKGFPAPSTHGTSGIRNRGTSTSTEAIQDRLQSSVPHLISSIHHGKVCFTVSIGTDHAHLSPQEPGLQLLGLWWDMDAMCTYITYYYECRGTPNSPLYLYAAQLRKGGWGQVSEGGTKRDFGRAIVTSTGHIWIGIWDWSQFIPHGS